MKVTDAIAKFLKAKGVKHVFGYQGGSVTHLIDSISREEGLEYIQNYHEQGASFCADAYARVSKEGLGVAIGTNGPGATNLITGIANAYCDSVPVLFLTGQVHTFAMKGNKGYRQESFQEIDIVSMVKPITKYCFTVLDKKEVIPAIKKAIAIALKDRKGPVLVDLPIDVQGECIGTDLLEKEMGRIAFSYGVSKDCLEACSQSVKLLLNAEKPLILCGGGINEAGKKHLKHVAQKFGFPVVASLMGLDKFPHAQDEFVGFIGTYGNRYANYAVQNADVLLVLGSRLDMRQTGKNVAEFASRAKIIHVDIDSLELEHRKNEEISILCDCNAYLEQIEKELARAGRHGGYLGWMKQITAWKEEYKSTSELKIEGINPNAFMETLGNEIYTEAVVCADVGQNQMWLAQSLRIKTENFHILNSGGLGAMGYALPACIGSWYAKHDCLHIAVMGDGGLQMNIQELQLVGVNQLPIIVIVMNNKSLGMIRDVHEKYYDNNFEGSVKGFSSPPLDKIAAAYGLEYRRISEEKDFDKLSMILKTKGPVLVEVVLSQNSHIAPELLGMHRLDGQFPMTMKDTREVKF